MKTTPGGAGRVCPSQANALRWLAVVLMAGLVLSLSSPLHARSLSAEQRLAGQLAASAIRMVRTEPLTTGALAAALLLAWEAATIEPEEPEYWRTVLGLARLAEDEAAASRALERLIALAPADEVLRLQWLRTEVERHQTVGERVAAYEALLDSDEHDLTPAIRARLLFDLANLKQRQGDDRAFAQHLAQAVATDPSYRAANAMAAGYFRAHDADALGTAEMLAGLFMADPMDPNSQYTLAQHLLAHGVYAGAERILLLSKRTHEAMRRSPPTELLLGLALARWGRGDHRGALEVIEQRQRQADVVYRREVRGEQPELSSLDLARMSTTIEPRLAMLRAAVSRRVDGQAAGDAERARALEAYNAQVRRLEDQEADAVSVAQAHLQRAWMVLLLDGDPAAAEASLQEVRRMAALPDETEARLAGWLALRRGRPEQAVDILQPVADGSRAGRLGLALALREQGRHRSAGRALLDVVRDANGTVIGLLAADHLSELLGQPVTVAHEHAGDMQRLIDSIPPAIDRFPTQPSTAVSIRLRPAKATFEAYEPVILNIEITNHAPMPLAIDRDGPIRPEVALTVSAEIAGLAGGPRIGPLPPVVVPIDRRLRLMPREQLVVPVDLRQQILGTALAHDPVAGAMVRVRGTVNFAVAANGALTTGLLGSESEVQRVRIDGARATLQWVEQTLAEMMEKPHVGDRDLPTLAVLMHVARGRPPEEAGARGHQLLRELRPALAEVFARLHGPAQAWLLALLPAAEEATEPILAAARRSDHRLVKLTYLVFHLRRASDPMLDAARRSGDPVLQHLADLISGTDPRPAGVGEAILFDRTSPERPLGSIGADDPPPE